MSNKGNVGEYLAKHSAIIYTGSAVVRECLAAELCRVNKNNEYEETFILGDVNWFPHVTEYANTRDIIVRKNDTRQRLERAASKMVALTFARFCTINSCSAKCVDNYNRYADTVGLSKIKPAIFFIEDVEAMEDLCTSIYDISLEQLMKDSEKLNIHYVLVANNEMEFDEKVCERYSYAIKGVGDETIVELHGKTELSIKAPTEDDWRVINEE